MPEVRDSSVSSSSSRNSGSPISMDSPLSKRRRLSADFVKFETLATHESVVVTVSKERLAILKHMLTDMREGEYDPRTSTSVKHTVTTREYTICVNLDAENDNIGNQWLSGYVSVDTKPCVQLSRPDHLPFFSFRARVPQLPHFKGVSPWREVDTSFFWGLQRMVSLNDLLKLETDITVEFDIRISKPAQQHTSALHSRRSEEAQQSILSKMHETRIHPDLTIVCDGEGISCHKAVLCSVSPVFEAMFREESKFHERVDNRVTITDFRKDVVIAFVDYVYLGAISFDKIDTIFFDWANLFVMAEKYDFYRLCEDSVDKMLMIVRRSIVGEEGDANLAKQNRENIMFSLLSFLGKYPHVEYLKAAERDIFDVAGEGLQGLFGHDDRFQLLSKDILLKWVVNVVGKKQ